MSAAQNNDNTIECTPNSEEIFHEVASGDMRLTLDNYRDTWERAALSCDSHGHWPTIRWQDEPWNSRWEEMRRGEYGGLWLPPLMLPHELGGWLVGMELCRESRPQISLGEDMGMSHQLQMFGWLPDVPHNQNCPESIQLHLTMNVKIGEQKFKKEGNFKFLRGRSWSTALWTVTHDSDKQWPLPEVKLTIHPALRQITKS